MMSPRSTAGRSPPPGPTHLHLVLVTETYAPEINGVAMTLGRLVDGLAQRGHRLTIIRPRQRHESPRFSVTHRVACRQIRLPGVPIPGYPQLRLGLPASRRLRQQWKLNRPDLVHVATEGPLGASAITTARRLGIPVTSSFHTNFDQYTRDYRIGWFKPVVAAWLRHVHNRTLRTFVPTHDLLARLEGEGYLNLRMLSRGVDAELFNPARRDLELRASWGVEPDGLAVIHVGRMAAEKNYPLLFRVFAAMRRANSRCRFIIVGDGPLRSALQRAHPDYTFTGFVPRDELACHYAAADIYIHASLTETFGNVLTEAMASGLAVAGFDYAAAKQFVRDGENGLSVPCDQPDALVAAAVRLATDPALRASLGPAARAAVEPQSWSNVIAKFETDLRAIIGGTDGGDGERSTFNAQLPTSTSAQSTSAALVP